MKAMAFVESEGSWRPTFLARLKASRLFGPLAHAIGLTLVLAVGTLLPAVKLFPTPASYLPLHTMLESVAIVVSAMVFTLGWSLRQRDSDSHTVLLGVAALCVLLIDLAHTLSYQGMPAFVTPSGPEKAIHFWLAGRLITALTFITVSFSPPRHWSSRAYPLALASSLALAGLVWWIGLFHEDWLPRTFIPKQGLTTFKIVLEYILAALYGTAAIRLMWPGRKPGKVDADWLAAAAWTLALAELFLTQYRDVTDLFNLLGHIYKALAYLMIYRAIFVAGVAAPYRALRESEQRLNDAMTASGEALWDWHIDSNLVYHNARWCQKLGLDESLLSHPFAGFAERVHEADRAAVMARIQACQEGKVFAPVEF